MPATVSVITKPFCDIFSTDISSQVPSIELPFSLEEVDATVSGDTTRVSVPGLEVWTATINVFWTAVIGALMWTNKGVTGALELRRSTAAVAAGNPKYTGTIWVASWAPISGAMGEGQQMALEIRANSALTRAES